MRADLFARFEKVTFCYPGRDRPALTDFSARLRSGLVTAILGPSGSGKTTLLKLLLGIQEPNKGMVQTLGRNMGDLYGLQEHRFRYEVGVVFQENTLLENLTVLENLSLPVESGGRKVWGSTREWVREQIVALGLSPMLLDQRVQELTPAERKVAAFAQAVFKRPRALLFDALETAGESRLIQRFLSLMREYAGGFNPPATIVFTTTQAALAAKADRLLLLGEGKLVGRIDTPAALLESREPEIRNYLQRFAETRDPWAGEAEQKTTGALTGLFTPRKK